jgi:hypothetical protein
MKMINEIFKELNISLDEALNLPLTKEEMELIYPSKKEQKLPDVIYLAPEKSCSVQNVETE